MRTEDATLLASTCAAFGVTDTSEYTSALSIYLQILEKWSRRISLVATRDPRELIVRHIADCLALLPHIPNDAMRLVDVGSGAGLPGLILAIARPTLRVVSIEPIAKKHSFQRAAARELALDNFDAQRGRVEEHASNDYDVAVSRATWSLPEWLSVGRGLVRPGGVVLGMEGAELHELPPDAVRATYPLGNRSRAVIVLRC